MGELVAGTIHFFSTYIFQISLVVLIFLLIRGYLVSKDIRFIKRKPHLEKVVVVESFGGRSNPLTEHPLYKLKKHLCEYNKNESDGGQKLLDPCQSVMKVVAYKAEYSLLLAHRSQGCPLKRVRLNYPVF